VLKLYERYSDLADTVLDIVDILDMDPDDLKQITNQMQGLDTIASRALPSKRTSVKIDLPEKVRKKFAKLATLIVGKSGEMRGSEVVAELGTALLINVMGFTQSPVNWVWSLFDNGPDQVAKHKEFNVWGIFEGKGGAKSSLNNSLGGQMGGQWLEKWIQKIYTDNGGPHAADLKSAFKHSEPMLAAVVRWNWMDKSHQLRITVQKYTPPRGIGSWGTAGVDY
jgi:hypothetical protein